MTQEEKQLLLRDLCARLPYGVKYMRYAWNFEWDQERPLIETLEYLDKDGFVFPTRVYNVSDIKPYLRPMSSMTEKEFELLKQHSGLEYDQLDLAEFPNNHKCLDFYLSEVPSYAVILVFDWLNVHHFDYRGLISMGLALEAPENMYNKID